MDTEPLSYESWVEEALRDVIKRALQHTASEGLSGEHHFFITFLTGRDDVSIPAHLKAEHPEEMTIVLQHQFSELNVTENGFSVTLSFSGRPCHLSIPYSAIVAFADPAVNFVLQLKMAEIDKNDEMAVEKAQWSPGEAKAALEAKPDRSDAPPESNEQPTGDDKDDKMGEVITLDAFRKK